VTTVVRAAAHVHSRWSDDATWKLPDIASAFGSQGFQVVLLADHSREFEPARLSEYWDECAAASTDQVLLVPGIEYNDPDNVVHVPVWGEVPFYGATPDITSLLGKVAADGGTAVLAHPWRREAWRRYDPAWTPLLAGVEVWNRKYDGLSPNRHAFSLAKREGLRPFASVDFHTRRQLFPLSVQLTLDGSRVDRAAVERALAAGAFTPFFRDRPVAKVLGGVDGLALRAVETARRKAAPVLRGLRRD
jgi:hypothetical protein